MEQLVILLVVGAIGLIKWVMEKSAEQRAKRETEERMDRLERAPQSAPPRQSVPPIDSFPRADAAARKFREALGLPEEFELPSPRPPAPAPPTFHIEEVKVVPVVDLERRLVEAAARPFPKYVSPPPILPQPLETAPARASGLDELLRSRDGLRKAILAQEILGTPKGLVF